MTATNSALDGYLPRLCMLEEQGQLTDTPDVRLGRCTHAAHR